MARNMGDKEQIERDRMKEENLRLKMALALMVEQFYDWIISPEEASDYHIECHPDDEQVTCYFHQFESAGEQAWKMLGLNKPIVSEEEMSNLINSLKDELLETIKTMI